MNILLIGNKKKSSMTKTFSQILENEGHNTRIISLPQIIYENWKISKKIKNSEIFRKIIFVLMRRKIVPFCNILDEIARRKVSKKRENFIPSLVIVFKGLIFSPENLKKIKKNKQKPLVFGVNADDPFNDFNASPYLRECLPFFDAYFVYSDTIVKNMTKINKNTHHLPFASYSSLHYPVKINKKEKNFYGSDIAFIGSWTPEREGKLLPLVKNNYDLAIWGNRWDNAKDKDTKERWKGKPVIGEEFSKVCNSSKIMLNFIRKQNKGSHNMRTFEVPACRGFLLSERTKEQQKFFPEDKEMAFFEGEKEMLEKVNYYLKNSRKRKNIAKRAYEKSRKHTYENRIDKVLEIYKNIKNKKSKHPSNSELKELMKKANKRRYYSK